MGQFPQLFCLPRRHVGYTNFGTWGFANSIRPFATHRARPPAAPSTRVEQPVPIIAVQLPPSGAGVDAGADRRPAHGGRHAHEAGTSLAQIHRGIHLEDTRALGGHIVPWLAPRATMYPAAAPLERPHCAAFTVLRTSASSRGLAALYPAHVRYVAHGTWLTYIGLLEMGCA